MTHAEASATIGASQRLQPARLEQRLYRKRSHTAFLERGTSEVAGDRFAPNGAAEIPIEWAFKPRPHLHGPS
jgi:hypothetical protein